MNYLTKALINSQKYKKKLNLTCLEKNADLCSSINNSNDPKDELYKELIESFFIEINNTIDLVYNLIISKQLGG